MTVWLLAWMHACEREFEEIEDWEVRRKVVSDVKLTQTTRRLRAKVYKVWYHTGVLVRRPLCAKRWENEKLARKRSSILAHLRSLNRFGWPSTCRSLMWDSHSLTEFILSLSVTKIAEDKERGRFVLCFKPFQSCFQGAEDPSSCRSLMCDSHT